MKRVLIALIAALVASLALGQTLRVAHHHAVGGTLDLTAEKFKELVEEKTNGELNVRIFPAAQLGQELEALDLVNQGLIDISLNTLGPINKYWQPVGIIMLPFVWNDWEHLYSAFDGELGDYIREGIDEASNIEVLAYMQVGFRHMLYRDEPVTRLADLEGVRMRSPEDPIFIGMFELLGARPTPVTWGEIYTAMQTGVAAGFDSPLQAGLDMNFNEVIDSIVLTNHMFSTAAFIMNERKFEGLSPEHQQAVLEAAREASDWQNKTLSEPAEQTAEQEWRDLGITVVSPEDPQEWADAMVPLWEQIVGDNEESQRVLDLILSSGEED